MSDVLVMGAVAYAPKVVTIWEGFKQFFAEKGLSFDYILYSNYERQVEQHFAGAFHVAWNSPLAWLQAQRAAERLGRSARAIAMRDTDCDLHSIVVVRADSGIEAVADLREKRLGVGARDSPQATLIPLLHIEQAGLEGGVDFEVEYFDALPGKHGDHVGGERDAARALMDGRVDAACLIEGNLSVFAQEGTLDKDVVRVVAETGAYDHCNFTVLDGAPVEPVDRFRQLLLEMSYDDPEVRPLLDLEGLKTWRAGRTEGYAILAEAVDRFGTIDRFVSDLASRSR